MTATTPLTREQAAARFALAAKGMTPANPKPKAIFALLDQYKEDILEYRDNGFSPEQIVEIVKHPDIGITTKPSMIKKYLAAVHKRSSHRSKKGTKATTRKPIVLPPIPPGLNATAASNATTGRR